MKISNKELVSGLINSLDEDGLFENPFLEKGKFKVLLTKKISESENPIDILEDIVAETVDECVRNTLNTTLDSLTEMDLLETLINKDGEIAYKLK